jgi:aerobic-type carbon monoxide dehydrogenase small subunit (CoxS/CutS family)
VSEHDIRLKINGETIEAKVFGRLMLADFLRHQLKLKGTHLGCEHGVCGACTVLVDGRSARSCLMLAAQADGAEIETIEGVMRRDGTLHPIQQAMIDHHGVQCGFCTPGVVMTTIELLRTVASPDEQTVRDWLSGNICRCTGYNGIVDAVLAAAATVSDGVSQ